MDGVAVATLRLRSAESDTPALRLRAARELQAADLMPAELPPAAVLVVRRVSDPLPGRFGGGRARPEWEAAVRQSLAAAVRTAGRPDGRGRIIGAPEAVMFADEAELVACLLGDIARGEALGRWWWRSVLPRLGLPVTAIEQSLRDPAVALIARPRETPAALTLASRWGHAAAVASRIAPPHALAVVAALARAHQIPDDIAVPPATVDDGHDDDEFTRGPAVPASVPVESSIATIDATAPWRPWLPPELATDRVAREVRCLFGVALGTYAAPARLRSAAAAAQGRRWWSERVASPATAPPAPALREVPGGPLGTSHGSLDSRRPETARRDSSIAATDAATATPFDSRVDTSPHVRRDLAPTGSVPDDVPPLPATPALLADDAGRESALTAAPSPKLGNADGAAPDSSRARAAVVDVQGDERGRDAQESSTDAAADEAAAAAALFPGETVHTRLGGVLYLVHALENLGLPAAFEEQWALASAGGPWGTLDLLARALLGRRYASFADDPLWRLLPRLAAWSTPRRTGIDPPYRIPADWLSLLDAGDRYAWAERGGRVWVWSTGGYLVAHRACRGDGAAAVRRELSRVLGWDASPPLLRRRPESSIPWRPLPELPKGCPRRIGRLAAAMAPAVRRRLLLALGIDPLTRGGASDRRIADILLLPAQLHVSSSHVDLVTRLDRVDLGARRAGLDRDPGWLPAYGRVIYFHFT